MFEQDIIMRQIHEIVRVILVLLTGRGDAEPDTELLQSVQHKQMLDRLTAMVDAGEINAAEDLLYESLPLCGVRAALLFYLHLNQKSDDFLEAHGFSREEIRDGILDAAAKAGLGEIVGTLWRDQ
ncbi:MAG: DUF6483 family protein [Clostridia bacterium]|nr:DUF6483 family protein [Clostridia bacterium]